MIATTIYNHSHSKLECQNGWESMSIFLSRVEELALKLWLCGCQGNLLWKAFHKCGGTTEKIHAETPSPHFSEGHKEKNALMMTSGTM